LAAASERTEALGGIYAATSVTGEVLCP
jgi:hypothetical protein